MQQSAYDLWKEYSLALMDGHCFTPLELVVSMNAVLDQYKGCSFINGLMHGEYTLAEKIKEVQHDLDVRKDIVTILGADESRWSHRAREVQELFQHPDVQNHWVRDIEGVYDSRHHYDLEYY